MINKTTTHKNGEMKVRQGVYRKEKERGKGEQR